MTRGLLLSAIVLSGAARLVAAQTAQPAQQPPAQPAVQTHSSCLDHPLPPLEPALAALIPPVDRLLRQGKIDDALELVKADVGAHPNVSALEDARGRVLYRDGELMPAIDAINLAIRLDPCNGRAHYDAWRVNATAGLFVQAQSQLNVAHSVSPTVALIQRVWANTQAPLPATVVADNPPHFNFYGRHVDCGGIPVRAASVVNPAALPATCAHIETMLAHLPNVRANLVARGAELHLYGEDQRLSDLPEYRNERGERVFVARTKDSSSNSQPESSKVDLDAYAGGLGGLYAACPEANVLHLPGDGYGLKDEVCVHEIAHDIMNAGFDSGMRSQIEKAFKLSTGKGLWANSYAATNSNEWWAELSVWYFGGHGGLGKLPAVIAAGGPEALHAYDPEAFALLDRLYSGQKQPKVIRIREARLVTGQMTFALSPDAAEILFVNNTPSRQLIFWVDRDGTAHDFGKLEPYSRRDYQTYTSQVWMAYDPRTRARVLFEVSSDVCEATLNEPPRSASQ